MREEFADFIHNKLPKDALLITCGLPATWKTETSAEIAKIMGYPILRTDLVRLEVLKDLDIFDNRVASNMDNRKRVYDEVFGRANEIIKRGNGLIIDATFVVAVLRRRAAKIACANKKMFVILETSCPREVSIARIMRRTRENYESNALTEQAYVNNEKKWEKIDISSIKKEYPGIAILHLTVDTTRDEPEGWYVVGSSKL
ncbi:MAG: ATP-binding protein [Candidatus Thermoplasmatota archaeon]|jgi:hypothetical protein|nr:ATP-binding protein [Candidatus Thermoplasmatota archaeon]MDP7264125.1 ATP-binding protein [Candidatus Thermoplasmatota archaeon]